MWANQNERANRTALTIKTAMAALTVVTSALVLPGCGQAPAPRTHLYIGLDMSGSVARRQGAFVLLTEDLARPLVPGQDQLSLYRVCRRTETFYDQPVEGGTDGLEDVIVPEVRKSQQDTAQPSGTFPTAFWADAAQRAADDPSRSEVVLFSDGDNDDLTSSAQATLRVAVRKMAANPHIAGVAFYGVNPENMAPLRRTFAPLGNRLHIYGPQENDVRPFTSSLTPVP